MGLVTVGIFGLVLVAWRLWRLVVDYRLYQRLRSPLPPRVFPAPMISVIVPARNEEARIGGCVSALLAQEYPFELHEILVVDDGSTDGTAAIVGDLADAHPRLRLLRAGALPPGWTGKPHACWRAAREARGDLLCFMDADTVAEPRLLREAVSLMQARGATFLSLHPRQELDTFWERLVVPAQFLLVAVVNDLHRVQDPADPSALANGQFILIRRQVYEEVGGHAAVRGAIVEDFALARRVKGAGHPLLVCLAEDLIRTRMYADLPSLLRGFAKNAVGFMGSVPAAGLGALGCLSAGWLPIGLLIAGLGRGEVPATALALALCLGVGGAYRGIGRRYGVPWRYALLFPLALSVTAWICLRGAAWALRGRSEWKGRTYQASVLEVEGAGDGTAPPSPAAHRLLPAPLTPRDKP